MIDPVPGLPDMVYAANGATVLDGIVFGAHFRYPERRGRGASSTQRWFAAAGLRGHRPRDLNEGEGDLLVVGPATWSWPAPASAPTRAAHAEAGAVSAARCSRSSWSTRATTTSTPRCPCSTPTHHRVLPEAFSPARAPCWPARFPDAVLADPADAAVLGLNAVSDGRHVVLPAPAPAAGRRIAERGYNPSPSTCPSCSRAAAGSSAARWRSAHDRRSPSSATDWHAETWWREHSAHNYHPLPVVVAHAEGAWVTDVEGRRYLDCLAGYSALNFGHRHPA